MVASNRRVTTRTRDKQDGPPNRSKNGGTCSRTAAHWNHSVCTGSNKDGKGIVRSSLGLARFCPAEVKEGGAASSQERTHHCQGVGNPLHSVAPQRGGARCGDEACVLAPLSSYVRARALSSYGRTSTQGSGRNMSDQGCDSTQGSRRNSTFR
jgi:hypothetical protein